MDEKIQNEFGRRLLGVGCKTTSEAVRGEMSLKARRDVCLLKFWGKIIKTKMAYFGEFTKTESSH